MEGVGRADGVWLSLCYFCEIGALRWDRGEQKTRRDDGQGVFKEGIPVLLRLSRARARVRNGASGGAARRSVPLAGRRPRCKTSPGTRAKNKQASSAVERGCIDASPYVGLASKRFDPVSAGFEPTLLPERDDYGLDGALVHVRREPWG